MRRRVGAVERGVLSSRFLRGPRPVVACLFYRCAPFFHCGPFQSLQAPSVIAGLTRNPVVAWHWIPDRVRDDKWLARDDIVIAGLTRNPVVAWHWIPDRVRDDNFLARDDNFMTRDDNFLVRVTNAMAGIVSAMAELTATAATAASPPGC